MNEGMIENSDKDVNVFTKPAFTVLNCNARSLCPKIVSLSECVTESDAAIGIVTETWMNDEMAAATAKSLSGQYDIGMEYRNRQTTAANGVRYGGVAIVWAESKCALKKTGI